MEFVLVLGKYFSKHKNSSCTHFPMFEAQTISLEWLYSYILMWTFNLLILRSLFLFEFFFSWHKISRWCFIFSKKLGHLPFFLNKVVFHLKITEWTKLNVEKLFCCYIELFWYFYGWPGQVGTTGTGIIELTQLNFSWNWQLDLSMAKDNILFCPTYISVPWHLGICLGMQKNIK